VINRSDLGNDQVKRYARAERVPVLMEIPFDRKIAEAYSKGQLLVQVMPEWKEKFERLYRRIAEIVE
jgi:MinD superfamily P-loop ATPase